jgi:hypothetical protein
MPGQVKPMNPGARVPLPSAPVGPEHPLHKPIVPPADYTPPGSGPIAVKNEPPLIDSERSAKSPTIETPGPDDTKIFPYFDGFNQVFGDPLEIDDLFNQAAEFENMEALGEWEKAPYDEDGKPKENVSPEEYALYVRAMNKYVPMIRKAFSLKEFDKTTGQGLAGWQVVELYTSYLNWKYGVKKNTE